MKESGLIRMDEVGRITLPAEMRKVLKLDKERLVELYIEKNKLIIKKYSPVSSLGRFSARLAKAAGDVAGAVCFICDTTKILDCSSEIFAEMQGKKISGELLNLINAGEPSLINAADGGKLFPLCEGFSFEYRAIAALPVIEDKLPVGCIILTASGENDVFSDNEIRVLKICRELVLSALESGGSGEK
ncbi:MAG: AbrB/MazE/SpoVT family DNA-binding domain-containing protein [Candidatus Borkfalkiaceae bacterium]|nr:AbrB/MazE/SpoVT family DNA-binding domain-containing protein [Christensenellaceae bacterium]